MRQSGNRLLNIRGIANGMEGKNYPFDDCMAFIMERKSFNEEPGENPQPQKYHEAIKRAF